MLECWYDHIFFAVLNLVHMSDNLLLVIVVELDSTNLLHLHYYFNTSLCNFWDIHKLHLYLVFRGASDSDKRPLAP